MPKDHRLSLRIDEKTSVRVDMLIAQGKFSSRSDFVQNAVDDLLRRLGKEDDDTLLMAEILYHLIIQSRHPAHIIPDKLESGLREYLTDRRGW